MDVTYFVTYVQYSIVLPPATDAPCIVDDIIVVVVYIDIVLAALVLSISILLAATASGDKGENSRTGTY